MLRPAIPTLLGVTSALIIITGLTRRVGLYWGARIWLLPASFEYSLWQRLPTETCWQIKLNKNRKSQVQKSIVVMWITCWLTSPPNLKNYSWGITGWQSCTRGPPTPSQCRTTITSTTLSWPSWISWPSLHQPSLPLHQVLLDIMNLKTNLNTSILKDTISLFLIFKISPIRLLRLAAQPFSCTPSQAQPSTWGPCPPYTSGLCFSGSWSNFCLGIGM